MEGTADKARTSLWVANTIGQLGSIAVVFWRVYLLFFLLFYIAVYEEA